MESFTPAERKELKAIKAAIEVFCDRSPHYWQYDAGQWAKLAERADRGGFHLDDIFRELGYRIESSADGSKHISS